MCASANDLLPENAATDDSDADSEADSHEAYYRQISAYGDSDSDSDGGAEIGSSSPVRINGAGLLHPQNPNPNPTPNASHLHAENGISALDLNGFRRGGGVGDQEEEEEEEDGTEREASIWRAFQEDESRRSAPLTPENAARVKDAMKGVSFGGLTPAWADRVPHDRWVDQLRRLRGEPTPQS